MDFTISSKLLLAHLVQAGSVAPQKGQVPAFENALISVTADQPGGVPTHMEILASDGETSYSTTIPLMEGRSEGRIGFPLRKALDTLKAHESEPVAIEARADTLQIKMDYFAGSKKRGTYTMYGISCADFPSQPNLNPDRTEEVEMTCSRFREALDRLGFVEQRIPSTSASTLDAMGVRIEFNPKYIAFLSASMVCVSCVEYSDMSLPEAREVQITHKALGLLTRLVPMDDTMLRIQFDDRYIRLIGDTFQVLVRQRPPIQLDYRALFPSETVNTFLLRVDRLQLLQAVKGVIPFTERVRHELELRITGDTLEILGNTQDSSHGNEQMACVYNGDDITISLYAWHLQAMLELMVSEEVAITIGRDTMSCKIFPTVQRNENEEFALVLARLQPQSMYR